MQTPPSSARRGAAPKSLSPAPPYPPGRHAVLRADLSRLAAWPPAPVFKREGLAAAGAAALARARVLLAAAPLVALVVAGRQGSFATGLGAPALAAVVPPLVFAVVLAQAAALSLALRGAREAARAPAELAAAFAARAAALRAEAEIFALDARPLLRGAERMLLAALAALDGAAPLGEALGEFDEAWVGAHVALVRASAGHAGAGAAGAAAAAALAALTRAHGAGARALPPAALTLLDGAAALAVGVLVSADYGAGGASSAFWAAGVFSALILYAALMIHDLGGARAAREGALFDAYAACEAPDEPLLEILRFGPGVDYSALTVDFGGHLRRLINDVRRGARARGGRGGAGAGCARAPRARPPHRPPQPPAPAHLITARD